MSKYWFVDLYDWGLTGIEFSVSKTEIEVINYLKSFYNLEKGKDYDDLWECKKSELYLSGVDIM